MPLVVAAGTRPPEGEGRDPPLVAELIADPEVVAIRPEPLGRDSIAVLARELHGLEPDEAFSAALETATGGNPLFVGAVLDAVAREGTSPTAAHVPRLLEIGAQGVSRAVGLRLARLPPEALALLRAASILGDGTDLELPRSWNARRSRGGSEFPIDSRWPWVKLEAPRFRGHVVVRQPFALPVCN